MPNKYNSRKTQKSKTGLKRHKSEKGGGKRKSKTYKKTLLDGGADPDNFFKGETMSMDDFAASYCLIFSPDKKMYSDGAQDANDPRVNKWKTGLYRIDIEDKISDFKDLFQSEDDFFKCLRTFMQTEMFIQDDYDEFLKYQTIMDTTINKMKRQHGDANVHDKFIVFMKELCKSSLVNWINGQMTLYTRNKDPEALAQVIRRIKPEYYFYLLTHKKWVTNNYVKAKRTGEESEYVHVVSSANRKFIYKLMAEQARIDSPETLRRVLFDIDQLLQINTNEPYNHENSIKIYTVNNFSGISTFPFTTNKWDIRVAFPPKSTYSYFGELQEVKSRRDPNNSEKDNMIPVNAMENLYASSIGEGFQRGGYEFILIKGKDEQYMEKNDGLEQAVYFRHHNIPPVSLHYLEGYFLGDVPETQLPDIPKIAPEDEVDGPTGDWFEYQEQKNKDILNYWAQIKTPKGMSLPDQSKYSTGSEEGGYSSLVHKTYYYFMIKESQSKTSATSSSAPQSLVPLSSVSSEIAEPKPSSVVENNSNPQLPERGFSEQKGGEENVSTAYPVAEVPVSTEPIEQGIPDPSKKKKKQVGFVTDEQGDVAPTQVATIRLPVSYRWLEIVKHIDKEVAKGRTQQDVLKEMHRDLDKQISDLGGIFENKFAQFATAMHANAMASYFIEGSGLFSIVKNTDSSVDTYNMENNVDMPLAASGHIYGNLFRYFSMNDLDEPSKLVTNNNVNIFHPLKDDKSDYNGPPRITKVKPTDKVETASFVNVSKQEDNIVLENEQVSENITTLSRKEAMDIFTSTGMNFIGFNYARPSSTELSYLDTISPSLRDAFFTYKTEKEAILKEGCAVDNTSQSTSGCPINKIRVADVGGVGAFGMLLSNEQLTDILEFLNVKTKGLILSDAMVNYRASIQQNIRLGIVTELMNPEKGYIYTINSETFHLGMPNMNTGSVPHLPVFKIINFTGIQNAYTDDVVERDSIIVWHKAPQAMRRQIRLGSPRLYYGLFRQLWEDLDKGIKDPLASLTDVPVATEVPATPLSPIVETVSEDAGPSAPSISDDTEPTSPSEEQGVEEEKQEEPIATEEEIAKSKIGRDQPVPRTMSVNVSTTIPGFQQFKLESNMFEEKKGGEKSKNASIKINPQIKLTTKSIEDVPDNFLKKQFFDPHLFTTLNNRVSSETMLGAKPLPLDVAVEKNVVDHNINLTLKTLFKKNTKIYLGGKEYTIYNADFEDTDWRLQPKDIVDTDLSTANVVNAQIVNIQERQGRKELQNLPDDVKRGDGSDQYIPEREKDKFAKKKSEPAVVTPTVISVPGTSKVIVAPEPKVTPEPKAEIKIKSKEVPVIEPAKPSTEVIVPPKPIVVPPPKKYPELPPVPKKLELPSVPVTPIPIELPHEKEFVQPNVVNTDVVKEMRDFFVNGYTTHYTHVNSPQTAGTKLKMGTKARSLLTPSQYEEMKKQKQEDDNNYYKLIDMMRVHVEGQKKVFQNVFKLGQDQRKSTGVGKAFNLKNYKKDQVDLLQMIPIARDGNCLFNCVSTAINMHNAYLSLPEKQNPDAEYTGEIVYDEPDNSSKVQVTRKGTTFTPEFIRWTVLNYNRRADKRIKLISQLLESRFIVYGYDEAMNWLNVNYKEFVDSPSIKSVVEEETKEFRNNGKVGLNDQYKEYVDGLKKATDITNEEKHIQAYAMIDDLFELFSNAYLAIYKPTMEVEYDMIVPFAVKTIPELEIELMKNSYYATEREIDDIQNIFKINIVSLAKHYSVENQIINGKDNNKIQYERYGFKINSKVGVDTSNVEEANKYNKSILLSFEDNIHYNLLVFDNSTDTSGKRKKKGGTRKYGVKSLRKTRKLKKSTGGAKVTYENRKKAIFFKRPGNDKAYAELDKLMETPGNNRLSSVFSTLATIPRLDDLNAGYPFYILLMMYSAFNRAGDDPTTKKLETVYKMFPMFFLEFITIDSIIDSMGDVNRPDVKSPDMSSWVNRREKFMELYYKTTNVLIVDKHMTPQSNVIEIDNSASDDEINDAENTDDKPRRRSELDNLKNESDEDVDLTLGSDMTKGVRKSKRRMSMYDKTLEEMNTEMAKPEAEDDTPLEFSIKSGDGNDEDQKGGASFITTNVRQTHPIGAVNSDVLNIMNQRESNLSFHVNVHLTLFPGSEIATRNIPGLACESRLQSIKMNWSKILGRPYYPTPRKLETTKVTKEDIKKQNE
jgi:hypothetical protein